jgi:hypothetical protein|uniref:Uncharacterized protein n=1 Tax=Thermorudis peleae TaxID=1382356 RepID=A0A831X7S5_9BACT
MEGLPAGEWFVIRAPGTASSVWLSIREIAWVAVVKGGEEVWVSYKGRTVQTKVTGVYAEELLHEIREWNRQHPGEAILIGTYELGTGNSRGATGA